MGCGASKLDPGPKAPVMEWYQKCVLDPDRLQERNGGRVGSKGFAGNQSLNRQLYVAAGRGDAHGVRRLAASGADVNVRLFQLINHYDGSNGQPSGHGVPLSKYRGRWIDQRGDWNIARWGCAGDPAEMTYASRTPLHEAAQRGSADTVAALLELGASPFSRGEGLRMPEDEANHHRSGDFSRCAAMLARASGWDVATAGEAKHWSPPGDVEILRAWYGGPRAHNGKIHDVHAGAPWLWKTTGRRHEDATGKDVTTIVRASLRDGKLRFNEARFCCNDIFGFGQSGGNATHGCQASLEEYENQKIEEWGRDVEASSQAKLRLPLIVRSPDTHFLSVNFDPALVRLLREVKYFLLLGLAVPDSALHIYQQVETFRTWTAQLDMVVSKHNTDLARLLPVEKPLLQPYLDRFDKAIEAGLSQLNWETGGLEPEIAKRREFIDEAILAVETVDEITCTMKANLEKVQTIMEKWSAKPLMDRKAKPQELEYFERVFKQSKATRYGEIKEGGKEIERMLKDTNKVLRVGDCYDALANLLFVKNEDGTESSSKANVMIAKDREQIKMHEEFSMEGEVEVYLNKLTAAMQLTLRNQLLRGIEDGVNWDVDPNLPRHKWCFKYPAQVVLTGSLIRRSRTRSSTTSWTASARSASTSTT